MSRRKLRGRPLDGWLIIDKPPGLTSTDVVNRVRRAFDAQKAGHGGTLDPLATGVLPIAFGAATKTVPYVMDGTKLYRFTLKLGEARDTDDADGQITATSAHRPTDAEVVAALPAFRGTIMQVPPAYSAVKVAGERAYDMARDGRAPVLEARPARVDRFDLIGRPDADTAIFEVDSGLADIPALALTEAEATDLSHGQAINLVDLMGRIPRAADPDGGLARAMAGSRVIGLCRLHDGWLKPERML
jgi:tRNA pseudouridine55 synthase